MAPNSTLTIDGYEITGTGIDIMSVYIAVTNAIESLEGEPRVLFFPITGTTDGGYDSAQLYRIRSDSSVYVHIIDDGTVSPEFVGMMRKTHANFMNEFTKKDASATEPDAHDTDA